MTRAKHFFLQPSLEDPFYVCGGWQIFNRAAELAGRCREVEVLTYRHREEGSRYLDDVPEEELAAGLVWVSWQSHVTELARRLEGLPRVVLYAQNTDFGADHGQVTPEAWPIVCLSRYIAADYAVRGPWRLLLHLPPALHPAARNPGGERDLEVIVHRRKAVPYLLHELVPALRDAGLAVHLVEGWLEQEAFLALLGRAKVYLYWTHRQSVGVFEGFGLQPLEAIACGATPVSNAYGGLGDYLEPPWNGRKIGVHTRSYDVAQIRRAVDEHAGSNRDEAWVRDRYGEEMFLRRFEEIERELLFYFENRGEGPPQRFQLAPPPPPLHRRPYVWLYRRYKRWLRRWKGILPK